MAEYDVVIVGGGQAGAQAAIYLRQFGFGGTIAIVGDENELPYERPPLSKEYLAGEKEFERLLIRPVQFWKDRAIELLLGRRVVGVDADEKRIDANGLTIGYRWLIWAAGGSPRALGCEGSDAENIFSIRTRTDIERIRARMGSASRIGIVGGGYIGLEAAAVFRKLRKDVVLFEAADRVLSRVAGNVLSDFFEREHRAHGVDLRTGRAIERLEVVDGNVTEILARGLERVPVDLVIVGIGIDPSVGPLIAAGAEGENGVKVDACCRTSLHDVFAIGDCALHPNPFAGCDHIRLESVQNANDQAKLVASAITGAPGAYSALPWFWSNQYDLKLQAIGLSPTYDDVVVRGDPDTRSFSILYLKGRRVLAMDCVNSVKDYVQGKSLILSGADVDKRYLADTSRPLKDIAASAVAV